MPDPIETQQHVVRVHDDPSAIRAADWNALHDTQASATPFTRHEYLAALHDSGSATGETGWQPQFLTLHAAGADAEPAGPMLAACPLYLKSHSYGEYVFDWAWADAYQRHRLRYYPKLLDAVPFTPVPGPRLLARSTAHRVALLQGMQQVAESAELSSAHLLFLDDEDLAAVHAANALAPRARNGGRWLLRHNVQFHWTNRDGTPWHDFADFLASLQREKRKKIQQERRRVADAGVRFEAKRGREIDDADWDYFYRCYRATYRAHHSTPYLTRDFFARMAATMPQHWLLFTAWRGSERVATSLIGIDASRRAAYGRYWGATEAIDCLHFEACYYQPLAWCIAQGWLRFEGGAQGEHKMARGLLPVETHSAHWLAHPQFADAVADFLEREGAGVEAYVGELRERNPFKDGAGPDADAPGTGPGSAPQSLSS